MHSHNDNKPPTGLSITDFVFGFSNCPFFNQKLVFPALIGHHCMINLVIISCFVWLAETEPVHDKIKSIKWRNICSFVKPLQLLVGLPFGRLGRAWSAKRNLHPAQLHQYSMLGQLVFDYLFLRSPRPS